MIKDCVFCKILAGEIPCSKVYEDALVLAFLDIAPINPGHTLVIPKEHHTSVTTLPPESAARVMAVATRVARAMMRAVKADGFNLLLSNGACAGQVVPHAHLHVIPRFPDDGVVLPVRTRPYESDAQREAILAEARKRLAETN